LFVDLDGTLVKTDTLHESLCGILSSKPHALRAVLVALLHGRASFKNAVASLCVPDARTLPYNVELLEFLRSEKSNGRRIYLATGANYRVARAIAEHLQLFDEVIASDSEDNRVGTHKLEKMAAIAGELGFSYAGNAPVDLKIWGSAKTAVLVSASASVNRRTGRVCRIERTFPARPLSAVTYLRTIRAYQWVKNLLLFLPVLPVLTRISPSQLLDVTLGAFAFCFCSSAFYIVNDLLDLPFDRLHPTKCTRPLAAGIVSAAQGLRLAVVLLGAGLTLAALVSAQFVGIVLLYLAVTATYSLWAKRVVLLDVLLLAGLYTVRVLAGATALQLPLSFWILAFSMSLFVSLAFVKRYAEVRAVRLRDQECAAGRGYRSADLEIIETFGICAGLISVLVLGFYLDQTVAHVAFRHSYVLGLLCPIELYWIFRVWLRAHRGAMHDDPVVFALRDRVSRYLVVLGMAIVACAVF
jgi:4-hydroxybenzoate polyprenyltransferase